MTNWGDSFGRFGRPSFGVGVNIAPEEMPMDEDSVVYESFVAGLDLSDAPEDVQMNRAVYAIDMEVTRADRLVRAPGVIEISNEPHSLQYIFQHTSIDYVVELVAIDPPWLGYKGAGAWNWVNLGLAATGLYGWTAIDYLGTLLASNGVNASYSRASGAAVVTDQSANVIARTFAQQFGRIFAGHFTSGGLTSSMGVKWNDTTALIGGWGGTGAGSELLLAPDLNADYVVALRALGFDLLAIICRNSLWAGYPTGRSTRPADLRFRTSGVGCVHERTARVTPGGVTFLSDDGVVNYDVNNWNIISGQINAELLPIDFFNLPKYTAAYIPQKRRYYLQTPTALYIYEFPIPEMNIEGRWFKRSTVVDSILGFSDQSALVTWDSLVGTWDAQVQSWDTLGMPGWAAPSAIYYALATHFGKEDPASFAWFGHALTPRWRTPQSARKKVTDQLVTVGWEIVYVSSADATINLLTPDKDAAFGVNTVTKTLPSSLGLTAKKIIWNTQAGMGLQTQLEIGSGSPEILRVRQIFQSGGPVIGSL